MKEYCQSNREKLLHYAKEYRKEHREEQNAHNRRWYQNNKDNISGKRSQHHTCVCGGTYTSPNKAQHERSKKHE
eukprot:3093-Eustigmatos_ZCMA.PRE.1